MGSGANSMNRDISNNIRGGGHTYNNVNNLGNNGGGVRISNDASAGTASYNLNLMNLAEMIGAA